MAASLLVASSASTGWTHVGAGVEPGFAAVYEVGPAQVHLNILIPEELLGRSLGRRVEIDASMTEAQAQALATTFVAVIAARQPVEVDGVPIAPRLERSTFMAPKGSEAASGQASPTKTSSASLAKIEIRSSPWRLVQLSLAYPCPGGLDRLAIRWGLDEAYVEHAGDPELERRLPSIEATLLAEGDRIRMVFRPSEPEYVWSARRSSTESPPKPPPPRTRGADLAWYLGLVLILSALVWWIPRRRPAQRLILLGCGLVAIATFLRLGPVTTFLSSPNWTSSSEALSGFEAVHASVYRAFHHTREDAILAELHKSVDATQIDYVYDQIHKTLILRDHTGVRSTVDSVEILRAEVERMHRDTKSVDILAVWRAHSRAEHWGHLHDRVHEIEGRVTIRAEEAPSPGWKLVGLEILDHRRITPSTTSSSAAGRP